MSSCQRLLRFAAFLSLTSIVAGAASAAELPAPFLAGDFAAGARPGYLEPEEMAALGGELYFSGTDPDQGREPWVSDGSTAGTRRLADLCFGECSSAPRAFTALGGAIVFHAANSRGHRAIFRLENGEIQEVWSTDDEISQWAALDSAIFFATRSNVLYRTDGTAQNTRAVATLHPQPDYEPPAELAAIGGAVYFTDAGRLYRIGEADSEPQPIFTFGGSAPQQPTAQGYTALDAGRFVFKACSTENGAFRCGAWVSDGTAAGTRSLETAASGGATAGAAHFLAWRGRVYFETDHPTEPFHALASTDGTAEGTRVEVTPAYYAFLLAATPGQLFYWTDLGLFARNAAGIDRHLFAWNGFEPIGVVGERFLFRYSDPGGINPPRTGFTRLAVSDGTPEGTVDLREGYPAAGALFGGQLYFGFADAVSGGSLWRSDGSAAGTVVVKQPAPLPRSGWPLAFRAGAALAVEASSGESYEPRYLNRLDPRTLAKTRVSEEPLRVTTAGGRRVFLTASTVTEPGPAYGYDGSALAELFTDLATDVGDFAADGRAFFFTGGLDTGIRLRESDGSAAGTRVLAEFPAGADCRPYCTYPNAVGVSGDLVFYSFIDGSNLFRSQLGVWDRSRDENRLLGQDLGLVDGFPGGRALLGEYHFPESESIFWRSDGTLAGTEPFLSFPYSNGPSVKVVAGNRFYLVLPADFGDQAWQGLWAGDLSDAGVRMVVPTADHRFRELVPAGDHLYFVYESPQGRELGFTDGSAAGTRFFDLRPGREGSTPQALHVLDDQRLVFAASGDGAGLELWISDGTAAGTYRLTDLNPGDAASSPREFLEVGGRLFFQASDGVHGRELWGLDLPPARPACPEDRLCLLNDRFAVKVTAHAPDGNFIGRRAIAGAESGVFTFFSANNWEMLVKVLDGCGINDAFWVSAAAASDVGYTLEVLDRANGLTKTWESPAGAAAAPILDIGAFPACGLPSPEPIHSPALPPAGPAGRCGDGGPDLCLGPGGRYRVSLGYSTANGSGPALPVADGSADSGIFTFFSPTNWEMMVKVLDGCAINGRVWVLAAGTTDVGWSLTVEDRETGVKKPYGKPSGQTAPALVDLGAFACD